MTAKEKALGLWWKYYSRIEHLLSEEYSPHEKDITKKLAVIAVDELIDAIEQDESNIINYWLEVKKEIERL